MLEDIEIHKVGQNMLITTPEPHTGLAYIIKFYGYREVDQSGFDAKKFSVYRITLGKIWVCDDTIEYIINELVRYFKLRKVRYSEIIIFTFGIIYTATIDKEGKIRIRKYELVDFPGCD